MFDYLSFSTNTSENKLFPYIVFGEFVGTGWHNTVEYNTFVNNQCYVWFNAHVGFKLEAGSGTTGRDLGTVFSNRELDLGANVLESCFSISTKGLQ